MESLGLALRVGLSLACVLGLVWLFSKGMVKGGRRHAGAAGQVEVLARHSLSRAGSLAVVRVGDRALVLGVTEQQVSLLSEADAASLGAPATAAAAWVSAVPVDMPVDVPPEKAAATKKAAATVGGRLHDGPTGPPSAVPAGRLAGSALSPATWSQAVDALRERTTRR